MISEKKVRIGYKVVRRKNMQLVSHNDMFNVEYAIGRATVPHDGWGPLCVFGDVRDALHFAGSCGGSVFECEYIESTLKTVWRKQGQYIYHIADLDRLPGGTKLADSVILIGKEIFVK